MVLDGGILAVHPICLGAKRWKSVETSPWYLDKKTLEISKGPPKKNDVAAKRMVKLLNITFMKRKRMILKNRYFQTASESNVFVLERIFVSLLPDV